MDILATLNTKDWVTKEKYIMKYHDKILAKSVYNILFFKHCSLK